jgi:hypothetical protein
MAGAGYKLFATGDVLTAAQVNTYLMQQTTMVFASSAARTSALSGVVAEGMLSYLTDTNALQYYDGSAWQDVSNPGDITGVTAGTGLSGGGTSGSVTLSIDSTVATLTGSQTLTNKTLTSPAINNATETNSLFISPEERTTVTATAATGTVNYDALTQGVLYYTSNASANFTLNFRGSGAATLSSILAVGDAISVVFLNTNGSTAYYPTAFQIDGSAVTPKWSGGTAPAAGNASAIDAYSFTIIKTAATPTYTVLAGGATKFA